MRSVVSTKHWSARFLFSPKTFTYLEKLREAAIAAYKAEQIAIGEMPGDKQKAREKSAQLHIEWANFDDDMKLLDWPR